MALNGQHNITQFNLEAVNVKLIEDEMLGK